MKLVVTKPGQLKIVNKIKIDEYKVIVEFKIYVVTSLSVCFIWKHSRYIMFYFIWLCSWQHLFNMRNLIDSVLHPIRALFSKVTHSSIIESPWAGRGSGVRGRGRYARAVCGCTILVSPAALETTRGRETDRMKIVNLWQFPTMQPHGNYCCVHISFWSLWLRTFSNNRY